jgi:hypothetical protein
MKRALAMLTAVQLASALAIGVLWTSELGRQDHPVTTALMWIWGLSNLPGILLAIPIGMVLSPGFVHADTFDGFAGFLVLVGIPTGLSVAAGRFIHKRIANGGVESGNPDS